MVLIPSRRLIGTACLFLPLLAQATSSAPVASPSTNTDLICPNDTPSDCYPKIFEPTKDFQVIKEGQDLPPGLHIRIDMQTGLKQARLNIPIEGEESVEAQLEGLPTENAMVVVDQPDAEAEPKPEKPALRDQVPMKPPTYENAGKVMPPHKDPNSADDMTTFSTALVAIKASGEGIDTALDNLSELAHDIFYGVEITKDSPVLEKLICLTLGIEKESDRANDRSHKAASILAASIQNNPTALKEIEKSAKMVMYPTCHPAHTNEGTDFIRLLRHRSESDDTPATLKARIGAISGLLREPGFRAEFLKKDGMSVLLSLFKKAGQENDSVKKKISQLLMDNFLDADLGAIIGEWPLKEEGSDWEASVRSYRLSTPPVDWLADLHDSLRDPRRISNSDDNAPPFPEKEL